MTTTPDLTGEPAAIRRAWWVAGLATFFVLVTANSGGYRFGVSDQAFYIPAIHGALVPGSFPRDMGLLAPQSSLLAWDELVAALMRLTGLSLESVFFGAYFVAVAAFFTGVVRMSASLYKESLGVWVLLAALTLRHRVAKTGVNTFEGYFHPRVLAFGIGTLAIALLLEQRRVAAALLIALAFFVHPTTALWFAIWASLAVAVNTAEWRGIGVLVGVGVMAAGLLVLAGPLGSSLAIMDGPWIEALAEKDYLFPTAWSLGTWCTNAVAPVVLWAAFSWRQRMAGARAVSAPLRRERALVLGCLGLVLVFAASLPFIAGRVVLAVQLQTSRVLWPVEWLATIYLVWVLVEAPWPAIRVSTRTRAWVALAVFGLAASGRAYYVLAVEHDRPLVALRLTASPWERVTAWAAANTPIDAHFLADPGHGWKFDSSLRVAARRDVLLEAVKDAAMATYARDAAVRVTERLAAIGDFDSLDESRARALATRYALDYLIVDRELALPLVHEEAPFRVYALSVDAERRATRAR